MSEKQFLTELGLAVYDRRRKQNMSTVTLARRTGLMPDAIRAVEFGIAPIEKAHHYLTLADELGLCTPAPTPTPSRPQ